MPHASWGKPCSGQIKTLARRDGLKLPVRNELVELIELLLTETERLGYDVKPGQTWGYACRKIRGSSSWSNHAWGLAIDINAPENPMGPRTGKIRKHPRVIALWKSYGFGWGGDYRSRADDMHMEFMGSVADAKAQTERARRELGGRPQSPSPASPTASNKLSASQIKWLAQTIAGKTGDDAVIAVAVALAESFEGDPKAYNGKGLDASYGLWQINMHGNLGPARRRQFGLSANEDLFNPVTNARAMREIHEEQGWNAWGAFTDGRYRKYLDVARAAVPTPYGQPASGQEDEVIRIIQTREHDGQDPKWPPPRTLDGVYVESNFSFVKWIPNGLVWSAIERHAQEGRRDQGGPVLVRRDEFDTLQKVGNAPWPEPYSGAK
jgi:hypothetical protein